jgi:putative ABC transport system permease protein
MSDYLSLSTTQVAFATLLILVNGAVSVALRLNLERTLLLASVRTVVQLLLVGSVLGWVFANQDWRFVLGLCAFMTIVAGVAAVSRLGHRFDQVYWNTTLSMWASSWLIGIYALTFVFRGIQPWYQPQYVVPVLGMILGNTLNGISIGLDSLLQAFIQRHQIMETRLCLGATRWEACLPELRRAVSSGMTPIINSMMIVGLVSLPGMMTGQLIAGTNPWDAVKYQIVLMFLIASATALGTVLSTFFACRRLLSSDHRLERFRIRKGMDS